MDTVEFLEPRGGVSYIVSSKVEEEDQELRFVWAQKLIRDGPDDGPNSGLGCGDLSSGTSSNRSTRPGARGGYSKQGKHQVNYSATKYIKPWRTGTKSQQLPVRTGFTKNSGKGGK